MMLLLITICVLPCVNADKTTIINLNQSNKWLILAYFCGDNDLDAAITEDWNEIKASDADNVRVWVLKDGDGTHDTHLYQVHQGTIYEYDDTYFPWLDDEENMGDENTLFNFLHSILIKNEYQTYRKILIFRDHGASWRGCMSDETDQGYLRVNNIKSAIENAIL